LSRCATAHRPCEVDIWFRAGWEIQTIYAAYQFRLSLSEPGTNAMQVPPQASDSANLGWQATISISVAIW
jgi:hypothetical protein